METCVQQYLVDVEMLTVEAKNILMNAEDKPIYEDEKADLLQKFEPVMARMKPLHEYLQLCPDSPRWAECAEAYHRLQFHMEALMKHNKQVFQI